MILDEDQARKIRFAFKRFVEGVSREWAKILVSHAEGEARKRAVIFLRTKNRRIRRKQLKKIAPWNT